MKARRAKLFQLRITETEAEFIIEDVVDWYKRNTRPLPGDRPRTDVVHYDPRSGQKGVGKYDSNG